MTTFDNDMLSIETMFFGTNLIPLKELNLTWPPPKFLVLDEEGIREATKDDPKEHMMHRIRMSEITDEQRESMINVFRGAEYKYVVTPGEMSCTTS